MQKSLTACQIVGSKGSLCSKLQQLVL